MDTANYAGIQGKLSDNLQNENDSGNMENLDNDEEEEEEGVRTIQKRLFIKFNFKLLQNSQTKRISNIPKINVPYHF